MEEILIDHYIEQHDVLVIQIRVHNFDECRKKFLELYKYLLPQLEHHM
jgi:hypothetical protein